jgi:hypothetical protein
MPVAAVTLLAVSLLCAHWLRYICLLAPGKASLTLPNRMHLALLRAPES